MPAGSTDYTSAVDSRGYTLDNNKDHTLDNNKHHALDMLGNNLAAGTLVVLHRVYLVEH